MSANQGSITKSIWEGRKGLIKGGVPISNKANFHPYLVTTKTFIHKLIKDLRVNNKTKV